MRWNDCLSYALSSSRDAEAKANIAISYGADPSIEAWPMKETLAHRAAALASIPLLNAAHVVHGPRKRIHPQLAGKTMPMGKQYLIKSQHIVKN